MALYRCRRPGLKDATVLKGKRWIVDADSLTGAGQV